MKITELAPSHVGKTIRVWDQEGLVAGTLETVSFDWGEGGENANWATGVGVTSARLTVSGWAVTLTPSAQVEFVDAEVFGRQLNDGLKGDFPGQQ